MKLYTKMQETSAHITLDVKICPHPPAPSQFQQSNRHIVRFHDKLNIFANEITSFQSGPFQVYIYY